MIIEKFEFGTQPIDDILKSLNLDNTHVVRASTEQLTHKMLKKAREGRRLTPHLQMKILKALNAATGKSFTIKDLFNY
ncbi:MAG: hypothetical protein HQL25_06335 [Candidatus Omnitrophica bacterium]|nr:hypothetical protein [Candidatus Omnitrophota bacterium]